MIRYLLTAICFSLLLMNNSFACTQIPSVWKTIDTTTEASESLTVYALNEAFIAYHNYWDNVECPINENDLKALKSVLNDYYYYKNELIEIFKKTIPNVDSKSKEERNVPDLRLYKKIKLIRLIVIITTIIMIIFMMNYILILII